MTNPQKRPLQSVPPPKQSNPAVDELVALRREMSEFRKDFAKFNTGLTQKIALSIIASFFLVLIVSFFLSLFIAVLLPTFLSATR
ncbi:hypothetical protein [Aulosira sp. FACHB-615]|uniref:hypothetical protein n=1 Tax=Aulosira sp. FACHB-615 TaxID=2692777 RepID=UPI001682E7E5|nr:hypothetical protein [Aulosira sp. FACHB-615]